MPDKNGKKEVILGLDLGTASIGWVKLEKDKYKRPKRIIDIGTRIFKEMLETGTSEAKRETKNKNRREKRGARKLNRRFKARRNDLVNILLEYGLLPESIKDKTDREKIINEIGEPFDLRYKGLDEPLTPHQFGRILLQIMKRRGYRSNRGAKYIDLMELPEVIKLKQAEANTQDDIKNTVKGTDEYKKLKKVLGKIQLLERELKNINKDKKETDKGYTTLGSFIYKTSKENGHKPRRITNLKSGEDELFATRQMYEDEFKLLWEEQKKHLPLNSEMKEKIHRTIFRQLPLKLQKNLVGKCSFEFAKKRAHKARLEAQEFRILQELNDLRIEKHGTHEATPLTIDQRQLLLDALDDPNMLNQSNTLSWTKVKDILNLNNKDKFNMQRTSKNDLHGNKTHLALLKTIPKRWAEFKLPEKIALVEDLLTIHDKKDLFLRLFNKDKPWRFDTKEAYSLATLELESGYMKHCLQVIRRLLDHMQLDENKKGLDYHDACQKAGYMRKDQKIISKKTQLDAPPYVANPRVQKALFEVHKLVNKLMLDKKDPITAIHIELARDMKTSKAHRIKTQAQQYENRKRNNEGTKELTRMAEEHPDLHIRPDHHDDILKYKLWQELGTPATCPYSLKTLAPHQLFNGDVQIDHIYPRSRSCDNSYGNKILCFTLKNKEKGNKTPFEQWGGTEKFQEILRHLEGQVKLKVFPQNKLDKIKNPDFNAKDFVERQLNETRYICIIVKNYLEQLGIPVQVTTGQATAEIRHLLGLNNILPKPPVEDEIDNTKKKKRVDHRHHAIDALVTALTDRKLFKDLQERYRHREQNHQWPEKRLKSIWSWKTLREDTQKALMNSVVSHNVNRKIHGALHKDMPFGRSYYLEDIKVEKVTKEIKDLIKSNPEKPDSQSWIVNSHTRKFLQSWLKEQEASKKKISFELPVKADGTPIKTIKIAHRCYVKRKPVKDVLQYVNNPVGGKTWIVDEGIRHILSDWMRLHKNNDNELKESPPLMPNNKSSKQNPIKTVRVASKFGASSIKSFKNSPYPIL